MYSAEIIADSINPVGDRITTFELTYPRMVHAEFMTHRLFSRNAASSRAIPIEKMIKQVEDDPVMFKWWGKNQKGMQAKEELTGEELREAKREWLRSRDMMVSQAKILNDLGLHKQNVNRILEPWMFITVIMTATEFENWYFLRDDPDAQPEIAWVAGEMRKCHEASTPDKLPIGGWHLPYVELEDEESPLYVDCVDLCKITGTSLTNVEQVQRDLVAIATARCARVSYLTHAGKRDYVKDLELHDRCRDKKHWSAFEHCAEADENSHRHGNFVGWRQYRKTFRNEHAGRILPGDQR